LAGSLEVDGAAAGAGAGVLGAAATALVAGFALLDAGARVREALVPDEVSLLLPAVGEEASPLSAGELTSTGALAV
jgi:hypothetical protein